MIEYTSKMPKGCDTVDIYLEADGQLSFEWRQSKGEDQMDDERDAAHQAIVFDYLEAILSICEEPGEGDYDSLGYDLRRIQEIAFNAIRDASGKDLAKVYWDQRKELEARIKALEDQIKGEDHVSV